ncbi:hypothetical protein AMK26_08160 [Streptomyces sp. CB03234]|uniref:hypothetical protein n=1 Tax=Streptomyces sp. (strain CB03234) TaxID=1703937 RepID=UPI00093F4F69|nr:hypothetical protein [Streptomyces sp. CB03234]OKK06050.1 hypothetical protein AMK26_08160 [Streptomyces sp. CB03234]
MSFGDPNNPYGQPQGQPQQPGYGYPQQGQPQQPGYGYPQQQAGVGGYPAAAPQMPGSAKTARVLLWVIIALQVVYAVYAFSQMGTVDEAVGQSGSGLSGEDAEVVSDFAKGAIAVFAGIALLFAVLGLVLALMFKNGANGVRVCTIVWASFAIVGGLFQLPIGIATLVVAIILIVFAAKGDTAAWFKRPRH